MPQPKVNLLWLKDLKDSKEREEFTNTLLNSQKVLDKLSKIVYNMCIDGEKVKSTDYDSPSWSHKQAHLNGERAAYQKILSLLDFKEH